MALHCCHYNVFFRRFSWRRRCYSNRSGTYDNANVGTDKAITISYTLIDGENAGLASNYTIAEQTTNNGVITAKPLTYTITGADKTYDGTVTATATLILSGFVGDETINVSSNTSTFDNKNAGSDKTITVNNIVLANGDNGGLASNYRISSWSNHNC